MTDVSKYHELLKQVFSNDVGNELLEVLKELHAPTLLEDQRTQDILLGKQLLIQEMSELSALEEKNLEDDNDHDSLFNIF